MTKQDSPQPDATQKSSKPKQVQHEGKFPSDYDIFIANSIYPDASAVFSSQQKTIAQIKNECFVVLDTNALLVPYGIGKNSLQQIEKTYRKLIGEKRLLVPGQVAREFAKNRAKKLGELFQQLSRRRNMQLPDGSSYPLLEQTQAYQDLITIEQSLAKLRRDYSDKIGEILDQVKSWNWNDPVSLLYHTLFDANTVYDISLSATAVREDLSRRQLHAIPPGYKDAGKDDGGVGDLLVWMTILDASKQKGKDVLFVTGDEKADWWHQSENQALYPRYELVDEFRRASGGKSFHIIRFSKLLDLYGATAEAVNEVRQEELVTTSARFSTRAEVVEEAVCHWLQRIVPPTAVAKNVGFPDFEVSLDSELTGVEAKAISGRSYVRERVTAFDEVGLRYVNRTGGKCLLFLVCPSPTAAHAAARVVGEMEVVSPSLSYLVGYLTRRRTLSIAAALPGKEPPSWLQQGI